MSILFTIFMLFVFLGTVTPFINQGLGGSGTVNDVDNLLGTTQQDDISGFDLFFSILKMGFWTFGELVWWIDMVLIPVRLLFWVTIVRQFIIGGGGA